MMRTLLYESHILRGLPHVTCLYSTFNYGKDSMGNFYVNYTLRGPGQIEVADALSGHSAIVTPSQLGCVVAFDEESEMQDESIIAKLALQLSFELHCPVLAVLNHDDDILCYWLYNNGELLDRYDSAPGFLDTSATPSNPAGGHAEKLCKAFGSKDMANVDTILSKPFGDKDGYIFAVDRHADLAKALGLPMYGVGFGYSYIERGELPESLGESDLVIVR